MEELKLSKTDILDKITSDATFQKILDAYKESGVSANLHKLPFDTTSKPNGLLTNVYVFHKDNKIIDILVPLFTTEKTTTWDFKYNDYILDLIKDEYSLTDVAEITTLTKATIFYFNKYTGDMSFLSLIKVSDWITNGFKSKYSKSVYFWNDKLPNSWSMKLKELKSDLFVNTLSYMSDKQIRTYCKMYAETKHKQFADGDGEGVKRGEKTKISNISNGIYAQIKLYNDLKEKGHDVSMMWLDGDDLGIDITLEVNKTKINIDVKSTKTDVLKISKFRKETDFYAVIQDNTFLGFINKYDFWESNITGSKAPDKNEKTGLFEKKLTKVWIKRFLKTEDLFKSLMEYKGSNMKRKAELFEI